MYSEIQRKAITVPDSISDSPILTSYVKFNAATATKQQASAAPQPAKIASLFAGMFSGPTKNKKTAKKAPILLLHGFDSSLLEFRRIARLLAEGDRDVYVIDILGWGFSNTDAVSDVRPAAKLEHIKCFIEQVIGGPCVLTGASLGGN
jgi:pimeloyl-ACP methyl ester carboxylesterase